MSDFETKELTGALFKGTKREGKQDPDYSGRCKIGGVEFRISAWLNESKSGVKYMSLKFREIEPRPIKDAETAPVGLQNAEPEPLDDPIPF